MLSLLASFASCLYFFKTRFAGQQTYNRGFHSSQQYTLTVLGSSDCRLDFLYANKNVLPTLLRDEGRNERTFTAHTFKRSKSSWKSTVRHYARSAAVQSSVFNPDDTLANNTISMLVDLVQGAHDFDDRELHQSDIVSCIRCLQYCKTLTFIKKRRDELMDVAGVLLAQRDIQTLVNLLEIIWKTSDIGNQDEDRLWRLTKAAIRLRLPIKVENIAGSTSSFDQNSPRQISYRALRIDIGFIRLFHTIWSVHLPLIESESLLDVKKVISFGLKLQVKTHLRIHKTLHHDKIVESDNDYEKLLNGLFNELAILTSKDFSSMDQVKGSSLLYSLLSQDAVFRTELMDYLSVALEFQDRQISLYIYSLFHQVELSQELPRPYLESLRGLISQHK